MILTKFLFFQLFLSKTVDKELFKEALTGLEIFDKELVKRKTPFFGGNEPGILDLMIWPWCERADIIRVLRGEQYAIPQDKFIRFVSLLDLFHT